MDDDAPATSSVRGEGGSLVGGPRSFDYSDGDAVEQKILECVSSVSDVSSGSDQLAEMISDWTTHYHLSPARADLLEPVEWEGLDVLEIGPGCGALTRYLGEAGAKVTAVEGSFRRAAITARRCRGLAGVEVFCDDFAEFPVSPRFDVVVVVGVLEYAPKFFPGDDPLGRFLKKARASLKPTGTLLVAIENRLGLKYFAGAPEDHLGEPFYGIEDRYAPSDGVVTVGKRELLAELEASGFASHEVIYPFPDYKHPKVLVRQAGLESASLDVGELIAHAGRSVAEGRTPVLFAEEAAWRVVHANRLVADLSNSLLVLAGLRASTRTILRDTDWLAKTYASGRRKPYRTVTTFRGTGDGIVVEKVLRHPEAAVSAAPLADLELPAQTEYLAGEETLAQCCVRVASGSDAKLGDLVRALDPWLSLLRRTADESDGRLPGRFIDCVPGNLLISASSPVGVTYFDAEWEYHQTIAPERVIARGMLLLAVRLERLVVAPDLRATPLLEVIREVAQAFGSSITVEELDALVEDEADWVCEIMPVARASYIGGVHVRLDAPLGAACRLGGFADDPAAVSRVLAMRARELEQLSAAIAEKDLHITKLDGEARRIIGAKDAELAAAAQALEAVETSLSWRITRPLRWLSRKGRRA